MKISTTWWVVAGSFTLVLIVGLAVWFAVGRSGEATATDREWSNGRVPADTLPPLGTDEITFEPAKSSVLVARWPGATEETGGAQIADLEVLEVQTATAPLSAQPVAPWTATVRVRGDTARLVRGAGFILPPGYPVHPEGLTGVVTAVDVDGETTVVTLGEAPMEQIFTSLHIAFHDMVDMPAPVAAGSDSEVDQASAELANMTGASPAIVSAGQQALNVATSPSSSIASFIECEASWGDKTPEGAPSGLRFRDAAKFTVEITEVDVAFTLDIGGLGAPRSSLEVNFDSATGLALSRAAEAKCSLPDSLMSRVPLGATGVTLDLGPQLEIGVSAGGAFTVAHKVHHSFGYTAKGMNVTPFQAQEKLGWDSEFSSVIEGYVSGGARAGLSFLGRGGGFFDVGPKVVVQLESAADTVLGKAERCLSSQLDFELGLSIFLDLWLKRWEKEIFELSVSPLFKFASSCTSDGVEEPEELASSSPPSDAQGLDLDASWCSIEDSSQCMRLADLITEHPQGGFPDGTRVARNEATHFGFCASYDLGDDSCSMAATYSFKYLPPGAGWDCPAEARRSPGSFEKVGCEPDYTWAHDDRFPRLVLLPNHQHDVAYRDSVPMYRSTDLDSVRVRPRQPTSDVPAGNPVDPQDYAQMVNPPSVYYSFETPSGLHTCTIVPDLAGGRVGEVGCDVAFNDSVTLPPGPWDVPNDAGGRTYAVLGASGAKFVMVSDTSYASARRPTVLAYGDTLSAYGVTCTTSEQGILCEAAGHTMQLSSNGYRFDGD